MRLNGVSIQKLFGFFAANIIYIHICNCWFVLSEKIQYQNYSFRNIVTGANYLVFDKMEIDISNASGCLLMVTYSDIKHLLFINKIHQSVIGLGNSLHANIIFSQKLSKHKATGIQIHVSKCPGNHIIPPRNL